MTGIEHSLGKGEVGGSIPPNSTINPLENKGPADGAPPDTCISVQNATGTCSTDLHKISTLDSSSVPWRKRPPITRMAQCAFLSGWLRVQADFATGDDAEFLRDASDALGELTDHIMIYEVRSR